MVIKPEEPPGVNSWQQKGNAAGMSSDKQRKKKQEWEDMKGWTVRWNSRSGVLHNYLFFVYLFVFIYVYVLVYLFSYLSVWLCLYLSVYLFVYLFDFMWFSFGQGKPGLRLSIVIRKEAWIFFSWFFFFFVIELALSPLCQCGVLPHSPLSLEHLESIKPRM